MVLEEAIDERITNSHKKPQLLLVSGKTGKAVEKTVANLAAYLKDKTEEDYKNALYTMNIGRKKFLNRSYLVCCNREECIDKLEKAAENVNYCDNKGGIVFMFPGQGTQYIGMAKELYNTIEVFRDEMDYCSRFLKDIIHYDLCEVLFKKEPNEENQKFLLETQNTHVALFSVEYALAKLLIHWGLKPSAMIGHSIGEYAAACISGVMDIETALTLIAERGKIIQSLPRGSMLSVNLSAEEAKKYCNDKISLAVENTNKLTVLSGETEAINELAQKIGEKSKCSILHTSHAFHSYMMKAGAEQFRLVLSKIKFNEPNIPYISNVTGDWIKKEDITDPEYWIKHLTGTVKVREGSEKFKGGKERYFFELGPGNTLSTLMRNNLNGVNNILFFNTVMSAKNPGDDVVYLYDSLGKAWSNGMDFDVNKLYEHESLKKISLPTYPFEKVSYWIDEIAISENAMNENAEMKAEQKDDTDGMDVTDKNINYSSSYVAPENEIEKILVDMLEEVIEIHPIGVTDNFIEIGGHSLIASQIISRIWESFSIEVKMAQFMDRPTIRQVAELIYEELLNDDEEE
jgi:acyl transferase domain-containing protein